MNLSYVIYLLTFLGFPILGFNLSKHIDYSRSKKCLILFFILFAIHNILFVLGYSLRGDYPDYVIFSLEYFYFSIIICLFYKSTHVIVKLISLLGAAVLIVGFLQGVVGILMFIVVSQDFETDKTYCFNYQGNDYQTRRYAFGFATLDDIRYSFETYRRYDFVFEKLVDKTDLSQLKSGLDLKENNFKIGLKSNQEKTLLEFSSINGKIYRKQID